ncbi:SIMPL domain-containing protein [Botryobacter ruber]|uniref:SIMPL domain-containing protein n=1 Tax=Botryobacter ruber TaxID=2171629 RepID=UPI000E0A13B6|nr:SIMPL domain-containing protein [Botryobacter ruber]
MKKASLFLTLLFLFLGFQVKAQQVMPPLISVTGVGEVKVQPNEVVVTLGVEMRDKSLEQVRKQTDAKAAAIISYLKKQGVDAKDIQTTYMHVQPVYSSPGAEYGRTTPDFYMANKTMTFVLKKLNNFDSVIAGLYEAGVNRVENISFKVSDIEKHKAEARKKAVADAKQKANALTSELGVKTGRAYSISENTYGGGPQPYYGKAMMREAAMDQSGGDPSIAGGEVVVTSNVNISFYIVE